jgi:hypothetical protein
MAQSIRRDKRLLAAAGGEAQPVALASGDSARSRSQEADPSKKRPFWEDRAPCQALVLGVLVLVGVGGYAWHWANQRPLPPTELWFRLTAAPGASSSAPSAAASVMPEWDVPLREETTLETTLPSEGTTDVTPGSVGREADGGTVAAEGVQKGGREWPQAGAGAVHAQDNPSGVLTFTATTPAARVRWRHVDRPRPPARPSFWQWLFGHKETNKAKYSRSELR